MSAIPIQLVSNVKNNNNETNYTNVFTTRLPQEIDALNTPKYIRVLNVIYPRTVKNINEDECWFELVMRFENFCNFINLTTGKPDSENPPIVEFKLNRIEIPSGIYKINDIIHFLNVYLNEYNVSFLLLNGKVEMYVTNEKYVYAQAQTSIQIPSVNLTAHYDFMGNKYSDKIVKIDTSTLKIKEKQQFRMTFSKKLSFILGLNKTEITFNFEGSKTEIKKQIFPFLPDETQGLNKMYIYCDKVQPNIIGNKSEDLLAVCPLIYASKESGDDLFTYSPPLIKKKLVNSIFNSLKITILDNQEQPIPFDSGNVNIECEIIE